MGGDAANTAMWQSGAKMVRFCPQLEVIEQKPKPGAVGKPSYYTDTGCLLAEAIFHPYNVKITGRNGKTHYAYVSKPVCHCVSCPFNADGCIASKEEIMGNIAGSRLKNIRKLLDEGKTPTAFEEPEMPLYPEKQKRNTQYKVGDECPHCGEKTHSRLRQGEDEHGEHLFCVPCGYYYDQTDKIGLITETAPAANGFGKMFFGGQIE